MYQLNLPPTTEGIRAQMTEIVAALVALPPRTEMARGPLERVLLQQAPGYTRDPDLYAQIFLEAANDSTVKERQATYWIETANGMRRTQPKSSDPLKDARVSLHCAESLLRDSTNDTRTSRLRELVDYHKALIARGLGKYAEEADAHACAAGRHFFDEGGRRTQAFRSLFMSQVARVTHAVMINDTEAVASGFCALMNMHADWGSQIEAHFGLVHLLVLNWIGEQGAIEDPAATIAKYTDATGSDFWTDTLGLLYRTDQNWADQVLQARNIRTQHGVTPSSSIADAMCLTMLVEARAFINLGEPSEAKAVYKRLIAYQGHEGGHFVKEVASRELDRLDMPQD